MSSFPCPMLLNDYLLLALIFTAAFAMHVAATHVAVAVHTAAQVNTRARVSRVFRASLAGTHRRSESQSKIHFIP